VRVFKIIPAPVLFLGEIAGHPIDASIDQRAPALGILALMRADPAGQQHDLASISDRSAEVDLLAKDRILRLLKRILVQLHAHALTVGVQDDRVAGDDRAFPDEVIERQPPKVMNQKALWLWGRIKDFERDGVLMTSPRTLHSEMTEPMRADVRRLLPAVVRFLRELEDML